MEPSPVVDEEFERAAGVLRSGGLVLMPSETVYGVYARASVAGEAMVRALLGERESSATTQPWTWHAEGRERIEGVLQFRSPLHRRLLRVLLPGPVRFHVERSDEQVRAALAALDVPPGIIDGTFADLPARAVAVRVPDHDATRAVLSRAGVTMIAHSAASFGIGDGRVVTPSDAARANRMGIDTSMVAGPTRYGRMSTAIRLLSGGGYRVVQEGALAEREVRAKVEHRILFVCSGNTCRSPVAEAMARHLLTNRTHPAGEAPVPARAMSAGTSAAVGMGMTPESAEALEEMGIDPGRHVSRQVDPETVAGAEYVFVMTRQHRRIVESMMGPGTPVQLLDPDGADIDDPVGGPLRQYREMAKAVRRAIERRLAEIEEGDRR